MKTRTDTLPDVKLQQFHCYISPMSHMIIGCKLKFQGATVDPQQWMVCKCGKKSRHWHLDREGDEAMDRWRRRHRCAETRRVKP